MICITDTVCSISCQSAKWSRQSFGSNFVTLINNLYFAYLPLYMLQKVLQHEQHNLKRLKITIKIVENGLNFFSFKYFFPTEQFLCFQNYIHLLLDRNLFCLYAQKSTNLFEMIEILTNYR